MSIKHLHRYVNEFAGRHNLRGLDTLKQLTMLAMSMVGKVLPYDTLTERKSLADTLLRNVFGVGTRRKCDREILESTFSYDEETGCYSWD